MTVSKNVDGQYYPEFHFGWGSCAEELFHYTSRLRRKASVQMAYLEV